MTAARDHDELHRLVDLLSPEQLRRLRVPADADPELHDLLADEPPANEGFKGRLRALDGIWDGPVDAAERHDELIRERLARST